MSIKARLLTQTRINAQVNPDKKIIPKQVSSGGGGATLSGGDGIEDFNFTGTNPKTVAVDDTVARTTSGAQTLEGDITFTNTGIDALNDVETSNLNDGELLHYDTASSAFVNRDALDGGNF